MEIRKYRENDLQTMIRIWNKVVDEGVAFPQEERLNEERGKNSSRHKATAGLLRRTARLWDCIFSIQTTPAA